MSSIVHSSALTLIVYLSPRDMNDLSSHSTLFRQESDIQARRRRGGVTTSNRTTDAFASFHENGRIRLVLSAAINEKSML